MMPTRAALAVLASLLVASAPRVGLADPPPGEFTLSFDGDAAIWNPFEGFAACDTRSGVTTCLSLENVDCDGAGRCEGDATIEFSGAVSGSGSGAFSGKTRCVATPNPLDPVCRARLEIGALVGSADSCELELHDSSLRGRVDAAGLYRGRAGAELCRTCPGGPQECSTVTGRFQDQVNPPTDWTVVVESQQSAKDSSRLVGSASDSLGFTYRVRGVHSVGNGVSTLLLRGEEGTPSEGARIKLRNLVFQGDDLQAGTANIRVQGNNARDKLGH